MGNCFPFLLENVFCEDKFLSIVLVFNPVCMQEVLNFTLTLAERIEKMIGILKKRWDFSFEQQSLPV